jgi:hypothetical protein
MANVAHTRAPVAVPCNMKPTVQQQRPQDKPTPALNLHILCGSSSAAAAIAPALALLLLLTQQLVALGLVMVAGLGFSSCPGGHTKGPVLVPFVVALAQVRTTRTYGSRKHRT